MIRRLTCAALGAAALACAPAFAQDAQAARSAVVASLAGAWTGTGERMNAQTQAMEAFEDSFTIAVIDEDANTFAFTTGDVLLISEDLGNGDRRDRTWVAGRLVAEETASWGAVEGPDAAGTWTVTRVGQVQSPNGPLDQTTVYSMSDGAYSVRSTVAAPGGAETPVLAVSYARRP